MGSRGETQYGLMSMAQLLEDGFSKKAVYRRVQAGKLVEVVPLVYRAAGTPESLRQKIMAGTLAIPGAVASHRTAAALHTFAGIPLREMELTVPGRKRRRSLAGFTLHRTNYLPDCDVGSAAGIPCTSPARTLLDIAGVVAPAVVRRAMIDAVDRSLVSLAELHDQLHRAGKSGRPGTAGFRRVLAGLDWSGEMSDSDLEDACYDLLLRDGYPRPQRQYPVRRGGATLGRVDLAYPALRLAIEVDSWEFHRSKWNFFHDRQRFNSIIAAGWTVAFFTYEDSLRAKRFLTDLRHIWRDRAQQAAPAPH